LDILASVRGAFNTCETDWYEAAFGEDYYAWNATRYELANLGVHTYLEGDYGSGDIYDLTRCNPLNPIPSLYGYVTHQQLRSDGSACKPPEWLARHKISVERALEMMTIEPAYAVSMEDYIGSIKPGKFADLIILSDDPLTIDPDKLIDLKVWMTMVNGEAKYCAQGHEEYCQTTSETESTAQPTASNTQGESISTPTAPAAVQTVQLKFDCDRKGEPPATYSSGQFILTTINWAAKTEEQVNNFLDAVQYAIYVNGEQIQSSMDHDEVIRSVDDHILALFSVLTYFDVGYLQPGEYEIRTVLSFNKKIADGYDEYGLGTEYPQFEGTCTVVIE
jgi:hypothetical protein